MNPIIAITARTEELRNRTQITIPSAYARVIEEAGGVPVIFPITEKKGHISHIARIADGFLFSGGDDIHPRYYGEDPLVDLDLSPDERTEFELALFYEVFILKKPVLGICLGAQLINVALGGTLYQDIPLQIPDNLNHREQHNIKITEGTMLHDIFSGDIPIFSTHHQSVKSPGKGLIISATSSDGVIEAIELSDYPFLIGVQWHPEREPESVVTKLLLRELVNAASR